MTNSTLIIMIKKWNLYLATKGSPSVSKHNGFILIAYSAFAVRTRSLDWQIGKLLIILNILYVLV